MRQAPLAVIALVLAAPLGACDVTRLAASSSASLFTRAGGAIEQHWDTELVGDGLPSSIMTLEGIFSVIPDDREVGIALARAYASYAYGWIEEEAELAEARGDFDRQTELRTRARLLYLRARNIAIHLMRLRDRGIDDALRSDEATLRAYLEAHYTSSGDAELVFWAGYPWGSAIGVAYDDPALILDLPAARIFIERAAALDESYFHYASLLFLAASNSAVSESLGGDPARGRELFERTLALTNRRFFSVQLTYARLYAVSVGDRALFVSLLREIIDGGDPDPSVRLANRLARRRAIQLLRRVDDLF
jgi:hypothetical protein